MHIACGAGGQAAGERASDQHQVGEAEGLPGAVDGGRAPWGVIYSPIVQIDHDLQ